MEAGEVEVGGDVGRGERSCPSSPMILSPDQSHAAENMSEDEEPSQSNRSFREEGIGLMEHEDYSDGEVKGHIDMDEFRSSGEVSHASEDESVDRADDGRHDKSDDEDDRVSAEEGNYESRNEGESINETVDSDVNENVDDGKHDYGDIVDDINIEGHDADHSDFDGHYADDEIIQTSCGEGVSSTSRVPVGGGNSNFSTDSEADRVDYPGEEDSCNVSSGNGRSTRRSEVQCEEELLPGNFPERENYGYERGHVESTTDLESGDKDGDYSVDDNSVPGGDENEASEDEWEPTRGDEDQSRDVSSGDTNLRKEGRKRDKNTSDKSEESSDARESDDNEEIVSQSEKVTKMHSSSSRRNKAHSHGKQTDSRQRKYVFDKQVNEEIDKSAEDSFISDNEEMQKDYEKHPGKEGVGVHRDRQHKYTRKKYDSESEGEVLESDERESVEEAEDLDTEDGETEAKRKNRGERRHDEREDADEGSSQEEGDDGENWKGHRAGTDDGDDISDAKDGDDDLEAVSEEEEEDEGEGVGAEKDDREIDENEDKKELQVIYMDENETEEGERKDEDEKNIGGNQSSEEESGKETEENGMDEEEKELEKGHDRHKSGGHASSRLKAKSRGKKEKLRKRDTDELAPDTKMRRRKKVGDKDWQVTDRSDHAHKGTFTERHEKADDQRAKSHHNKHKITWDRSPRDGMQGDNDQELGREKRVPAEKLVTQTSLSEEHIELDYEEEMEGHEGTKDKLDDSKEDEEGAIKEGLSSDGELEDDEDCEEGEIREPGTRKPSVKPICRFYLRGHCTWGVNCRFIHPGVNDKGNYQLIERPGFNNIHGMGPRGPYGPDGPWQDFDQGKTDKKLKSPEELEPPPPIPQPKAETAWERGLRQAKEVRLFSEIITSFDWLHLI
ncbi:hypothetical protein CHS0354_013547 [Potamilus streckersoni]|uniref:C3H1-type domain-containing protein n=1 Tax=Potamilus streckersoni TaxID=2493646 RepID=A0AAE0WA47_9BIVA|nr:hypothetical protein CHS0354_013547 [Potamilus streckersoni]